MKYNHKKVVSSLLTTGILLSSFPSLASFASAKTTSTDPNIILILADDLGYSDISCYGGDIPTPNIDRIADNGVRLTQFCNTARCSPSRASLLTGLYPHQAGMAHLLGKWGTYTDGMNDNTVTIADVLGEDGYNTAHFGKWHLGTPGPLGCGFDTTSTVALPYFQDMCKTPTNPDGYTTDYITEKTVSYIENQANSEKHFFAYVAHNSPHFPLSVPEADVELFHERYNELNGMPADYNVFEQGWDILREDKYERMIDMGIIDADWTLPSDTHEPVDLFSNLQADRDGDSKVPYFDSLTEAEKKWYIRAMEVYAGMITGLDRSVGEILDTLEETGQLDNSIVIFMSDNGGNSEFPNANLSVLPGGKNYSESNGHIGYGWASYSNTPFSMYKHYIQQGGIAAPFIISWPDGINSSQNGTLRHSPAQLTDVMATIVDITGAKYPTIFSGHNITPMQGTSMMPIIENDTRVKEFMYWEHEGNCGVRWYDSATGRDLKLVRFYDRLWELYDMINDGTETNDLAASQPEIANFLADKYSAWTKEADVLPLTEYEQNITDGTRKMGNHFLFVAKSFEIVTISLTSEISPEKALKLLPCRITAYSFGNKKAFLPIDRWVLTNTNNGSYTFTGIYEDDELFDDYYRTGITATVSTNVPGKPSDDLTQLIKIASAAESTYYTSESYAPLPAALDNAKKLINEAGKDDNALSDAILRLSAAIEALELSTLPSTPSLSFGVYTDKTDIFLSWKASRKALSYAVLFSTTADGEFTVAAEGITDCSCTITVPTNENIYFKIYAVNSTGKSPESVPYEVRKCATSEPVPATMPDINANNGILWYSFDTIRNIDTITDDINRQNSAGQQGMYLPYEGYSGGAYLFSDIGDRILVTNDSGTDKIRTSYSKRTVSFYFMPFSLDGIQMLYCQGGDIKGTAIRLNNGKLEAAVRVGGEQSALIVSSSSSSKLGAKDLGTWCHAALVFDNGAVTLYLNGIMTAKGTAAAKTAGQPVAGLTIGAPGANNAFKDSGTGYTPYLGLIDDVRIYNDAVLPILAESGNDTPDKPVEPGDKSDDNAENENSANNSESGGSNHITIIISLVIILTVVTASVVIIILISSRKKRLLR